MKIIKLNVENKGKIKMTPEMLNLLGCTKDNFIKLLIKMGYRITENNTDVYFKYLPPKNNKKIFNKKISKENPFGVLKNLNLR